MNKLVSPELGGLAAAEPAKFDFNAVVPSGPAETVIVPDAHLLFSGDYARSGRDLVISDQIHRYVLHDYFAHEKRPTLVSPEGAPLDPRFIDAITGYTKYAQAGTSAPSDKVVGHVVVMTGSASIVRNGVAIVVNTGDTIYRNDVIQTGSNSTLGMVLDDGSAFNLAATTRFVVNELDYDPAGTANQALFSLIQGSLSLIAGQVAPTGDMKVTTPVATIGVRGTVLLAGLDSTDGHVNVSVADQQDGVVHVVEVFNNAGDRIGTVSSNGPSLAVTPGANFQVTTQEVSKTPTQVAQEFSSVQQLQTTYDTGKLQYPNLPQHTENTAPNNNTNTASTKTAAVGSPPVLPSAPPSTTVFTDPSGSKSQTATTDAAQVQTVSLQTTEASTTTTTSQTTTTPPITSEPLVVTVTIDPIDGNDQIGSADAAVGVAVTGSISGLTAGSTFDVTVTNNGVVKSYVATVNGAGTGWSATIPAADAIVLANGAATVAAQVTGADGSQAYASQAVTVAETGPTVSIAPVGGNGVINAVEAAAGVTLKGSVTGLVAGSTFNVTVTDNGVTKTYVATVNGAATGWSATIPSSDATALANGTATVSALVTDADGNQASASLNVTVAETLPTVAINPVDGTNVINAANAAAGVTLGGSVSGLAANSTFNVTVTDNGVTKTYLATVDGTGTGWSATIPAGDATTLANGTATIAAQVTDGFGNPASFSQNVTVAETGPVLTINPIDGNNIINAANAAAGVTLGGSVSGIASNSTFNVTVTDNGVTKTYTATVNGSAWSATIPAADAIALANGTATIAAQVTDSHGNPANFSQNVTVAETLPTVTSLTDTTTNGSDLNAGQSVTFTLAASETLTIANGAALTLSNGASAVYNSATGKFVYTIKTGDTNTGDLTVTGYTGSITDSTGNALVPSGVTLDTHIQIDTVAPTVVSLTNTTTNGSDLNAGQSVTFTLAASETLTIANGAALTLSNGASAVFNSATGKFVYTVQSGDTNTSDLTVTGYTGSITDAAGNALVKSGVTLDTHVQIDTVAPTVASLTDTTTNGSDLNAGQSVTFTLTSSEPLTIANGAALTLSNGASAIYNSATGKFVYTVIAGQDTGDLTVTGYSGSISDGAGNALVKSGVTLDTHVQIDTVAPTVASLTDTTTNGSDLDAGQSVTFTLTDSEALAIANGAALTLSNGASAVYNSTTAKFVYTVQSGDINTSDLTVTGYTGSIADGAGNALVKSGVTLDTHVQIDTVAPTVVSLADATTNGSDLNAGQSVTFTLTGSETLTIANGAALTLSNGASAVYNSTTAKFVYTVLSGDTNTSDLTVTGYTGSITDAAGNALVKSGVTLDTHVQIDTIAPTVTSLTDTTTNGSDLNAGQSVTFTLSVSETLTIANGAALTLSNGASALYNSSTGQFVYTVVAGQDTSDLTVTGYSGSITDGAGNALVKSGVTLDTHVQIDTTAPTVSINTSGGTTNQNVQLISGSADIGDVGATVNIYDNGGLTPVATTTVLAGGNWNTDVTLATGPNLLVAKVTDGAGNTGTSNTVTFDLSTTAPTVTSLTDATSNGTDLDVGQSVTFTLTASEALTVASGAALTLNNGATAVYSSGSGTTSLTFVYTVASGHDTNDLTVTGYTGSIKDTAGNGLVTGGVTLDTGVQIDTTAPTVASVTAPSGDDGPGTVVAFTVNFSEAVTVNTTGGSPTLTLSNGATATYVSGSGSTGLVFNYTVGATGSGQDATDLATATNALLLNGATIKDTAGNVAVLTGASNVNPTGTLQIDTTAPTVASVTAPSGDDGPGTVVAFTVNFTEAVTVNTTGGSPTLTLSNGATATYVSGSGSTGLVFNYTVGATGSGQDATDLATAATNALLLNGATIKDVAGNVAVLTGASNVNPTGTLQIDTTAPTVASVTAPSGDDGPGTVVAFTVNFTEAVTVNTTGGSPTLTLSNGATATYVSGSGSTGLVFNYTVGATGSGQDATDLATAATNALLLNGATIKDVAGNVAVLTGASNVNPTGTLQIDTTAPTVASVTAPSGDDGPGTVVAFTVNFTEAVTVNTTGGSPTLTLSNGATATYVSGSGSTSLVFNYTVGATGSGQDATDLATAATNALLLNGATIKDVAGNVAVLTGASNVNPTGTLQIDTTAPTVASVTAPSGDDGPGTVVAFTVNFSEVVTVNTTGGSPTLKLSNGAIATYVSGSGSTSLVFNYTVGATGSGQDAADLATAATNALLLNGGTIKDAAGNAAVLTGASNVNPTGTLQIDTTAPTVSITTTGGTTSQTSQTISGQVDVLDAGATVKIFDNGGTTAVATTTVLGDGSWSISVPLVSGTNSLVAKVTDAAGNVGTSNTVQFTLPNFTVQWIGQTGQNWGTAGNWSTLALPISTDDVLIGVADNVLFNSSTSTIDGLYSVAGSTLSVSNGTFTVSSASTVSNLQGSIALSGGTFTSNAQMTVGSLNQSGGTLSGSGLLTVTGATSFSGNSTETGSGAGSETKAQSGATFAGGTTLTLSARTLDLQGTSSTTGAGNNFNDIINLNNGSSLTVDVGATFTDATITGGGNALVIQSTSGTAGTVTNLGTWQKTGNSSGNDTISVAFSTTNGTVLVQNGVLNLTGGGTDTNASYQGSGQVQFGGGTRTLDSASSITSGVIFGGTGTTTTINGTYNASSTNVQNGTANLLGTITGLGATTISSGTLNLSTAGTTATSLTESGGTLTGSGLLTVTGATSFSGNSTETGSGAGSETKAQSGATFAGGTTLTLSARTLDLQGTSSTTGAGNNFNDIINLNNGSSLTLDVGATFTDATITGGGNALVIQSTSGTAGTVTNLGTWQKTGNSSGNDTISVAFSTTNGTVLVNNGVLNLTGGGTDTNASYQGAGSIEFGGGTRTLDSASSITSGVIFGGGTTTVNGTYNASSTTVNGGTANLLGTITGLGATTISSGTLNLSTAGTTATSLTESGGTLTGSGLLTVTGATSFSGNSTETGSGAGSETKAQSGATFAGGTTLTLSARTLDLQGTSSTTGAGNNFNDIINLNNGSSLTLDVGATFTDATITGGGNALVIQSTSGTAGTVTNLGTWQKTGNGKTVVNVAFNNSGSINVQQGTLQLMGTLTNLAGSSLIIQNATIELAAVSGGTNVSFGGTSGTLQLDSTVSSTQSAAVSAVSSGAAVTITGNGSVTSTLADAIDVTASGGNVSITPAGAVTGGKIGISVVQNGTGNITVTGSGPIIGQSGQGIFAEENSSASGSISINGSGNVTGTGTGNSGILAEILNPANSSNIIVAQTGNISGGNNGIRAFTDGNGNVTVMTASGISITGSQLIGISAASFGTGSVSVTTASGDIITSGSAGISAFNDATSVPQVGGLTTSSITVTAAGTINSGTTLTSSYFPPAGIIAGYNGTTANGGSPNPAVFGNVFVNNSANINAAAGDGIRTYNYGNGNITVADLAGTTVTTPDRFGILASVFGVGDISISTAATSDTINSGSTGIQANNNAINISAAATSTIGITALGTINSGLATTGGEPGGIWAGYNGGNSGTFASNVQGNVSVDSSATIHTALGAGVGLYNWGTGNVTATLEASSIITATAQGVSAFAQGGGNAAVTNHGAITVATGVGISAGTGTAAGAGTNGLITVTNTGSVDGLGSVSRPVIQINNESTKAASFANSGTVTADQFSTSEQNLAVADYNGSLTINNSGTIKGNIGLANGTFNNNSGGIWNVNGGNFFGGGTNAVNNAGTINASGTSVFGASGTLAFNNSGAVNLSADSYTYIGGAVSGFNGASGTFTIGDFSTLELTNAFAAGQAVSFFDGNGLLMLDDPSAFAGLIANMQIGDTIQLSLPNGVSIQSASVITQVVSGVTETFLQITLSNSTSENIQLSNFAAGAQFSLLSSNEIQLVPSGAPTISGSSGPLTEPVLSSQQFYVLSNATISGSGGPGFAASSSDPTAGHFLTVEITQGSSISGLSGTANGVNLTTTSAANANIALVNAGSITSAGGNGINTSIVSGTGATIIVDSGSVSGAVNGINASTTGTGPISIDTNGVATITGTGAGTTTNPGIAISAVSSGGNVIVNTSPGNVLNSGSSGINAQDHASSIAQSANSSISVSTDGTINSGATPPSAGNEPGGIKAGFNGGSGPTTAVFGNVTINNGANITAGGGYGIFAFNDGVGNISVTDGVGGTGVGGNVTATAAGTTGEGNAQYGIGASAFEAGNINVTVASGTTIHSGSSGIQAINQANSTANPENITSSITVVAQGTIDSGVNEDNGGFAPAGIEAGFNPSTNSSTFNPNVAGNVLVDLAGGAGISAAAGDGIKAFNYGNGNVTVQVASGSSITATQSATTAQPNNQAAYGIGAFAFGTGNIAVTTAGDTINSGSAGIDAVNEATAISVSADATVMVTAAGSINAGTILTNSGSAPSGIVAGFFGGTSATANLNVNGTVIINNSANVDAAGGPGINAFNFGQGDVTVNDAANTTVIGETDGIRATQDSGGTGDVAVNVVSGVTITGTTDYGIFALSTGAGDISISTSSGDVITGGVGAIEASTTGVGTAAINNGGHLIGDVVAYDATFTNETGAEWSIDGTNTFTGTSTLTNTGLIESNGTSSITGLSGTTNVGTIQVETGNLTIAGPVTGGGAVMIVSGTMEFAGASDAHVQFATGMSTTGTLVLDDVVHSPFTGTVTGFAPGDTIDLVGISSGVTVTNSGGLQVNYGTGSFALTGNYNPSEFTVGPDGSGGTDITWNHQAPFILTNNLSTTNNGGTTTVSGLQISDSDPGVTSITLTATTAEAAEGSSISPASTSGSLSAVNAVLASGITYNPGATPPSQDMVTLTAVDNFGATETVNFVFNENSNNNLKGTTGNDVIFSGGGSDVLTGGGGIDQFVFKPTGGPTAVQHTITDFNASLDTLDLRQFSGTSTSAPPTETQVGNDTLVTIDATDSVLLKNVAVASLHASNFILHS
ncbi:hypothetical protein [Bradyrhizobium erythrophlei]|uniref:FecR family protein n=1 Tax=Bradyrhizobium erythrophlei TaxID=1437360 RepID=A0A1M7TR19_9BRAD|nr:hypothetical protein [Bradyrhizobium erythrophlei]SHN73189.1 hypothetical protein SAMN05444170_2418 [Bradyrhizobium erythrophlei]